MLNRLLKLLLLVVVVVAVGAFFLGYRWAGKSGTADVTSVEPAATATTGTAAGERNRARAVGAEIGETVAVGATAAQRAIANGQLTAKIKAKMTLDDSIHALAIDVDTSDGVVTLSGEVGSSAQRARALQLARETDGVASVVDHLRVR
jgi:hyperosmotically inducible periplasmic protein